MRSFWAIAGFAIAVILTYRALRSPNGSQRRQAKRQSPSHNNEDSLPSGVSSSSQDSRTQNATDEFFPPANVTLGQIVRRRLSDGRKNHLYWKLQMRVLIALENSRVFTSGLVKHELVTEELGMNLDNVELEMLGSFEKVFLFQKAALYKCNIAGNPAVVTRLVDSMTDNLRATRAEATDVVNAVLDGNFFFPVPLHAGIGIQFHSILGMASNCIPLRHWLQMS
ncbi:hypothetical protein L2E82_47902 [Cichorium intybus]|uniref:Uncharacterized protein n=1 Tax=Cichorium intybus TaxID=13427 RepID=A0ACB8YWW2_CICIN|nr:hypothetical protein L2E82_47902 [Cichorium intybus]